MAETRFRGLSQREEEVFGAISINQDTGHPPNTIESLLRKGLIEEYTEIIGGRWPVVIRRYSVPLHIHIEWCYWCSENVSEEELEEARH